MTRLRPHSYQKLSTTPDTSRQLQSRQ